EAQIVRERREAKLGNARGEAETIPDTRELVPAAGEALLERQSSDELTLERLSPVAAKLESELVSAGLRPHTSGPPPPVGTWRPPSETNRYAIVGTAFIVGVVIGLFAGSLGQGAAQTSSRVALPALSPQPSASTASVSDSKDQGSLDIQSEP